MLLPSSDILVGCRKCLPTAPAEHQSLQQKKALPRRIVKLTA